MTKETLAKIISDIEFNVFGVDFEFLVHEKGDGFLIQVVSWIPDNDTHDLASLQKGAKHYISSHACKDEVVNKCWYACQDFIIHEARESFKYKDCTIYQPHWKVDRLVELRKDSDVARRK